MLILLNCLDVCGKMIWLDICRNIVYTILSNDKAKSLGVIEMNEHELYQKISLIVDESYYTQEMDLKENLNQMQKNGIDINAESVAHIIADINNVMVKQLIFRVIKEIRPQFYLS